MCRPDIVLDLQHVAPGFLLVGILLYYIGIFQMLSIICVCQVKGEHPAGDGVRTTEPYFDSATVECAIQLCPEQLKNGEMLLAMMCWF